MVDRLALLRQQIELRPDDPFPRYAFALELREHGKLQEAVQQLRELAESHSQYVPTYFHLGQLLEKVDEPQQAKEAYELGIREAERAGDTHALSELRGALQFLSDLLD